MPSEVQPSPGDVREELGAICAHKHFARSDRLRQFLHFIVEQTLLEHRLNEQVIGVNVFGREPGYDSGNDTIVRTQAVKLRKRLEDYYRDNPEARVRISILKGSYSPTFTWVYQEPGKSGAGDLAHFPDIPELLNGYETWRDPIPGTAQEESVTASAGVAPPKPRRFSPNWKIVAAVSSVIAAILTGLFFWISRQETYLTGNHAIVLADFANTTGEPIFDGTLRRALGAELEQTPFLHVLSDGKVSAMLKLMNQPQNAKLTNNTAREICERTNSEAVIEGSIASVGVPYLIDLRAVNCHTAETLASAEVTAKNRDAVLNGLKTAVLQLRHELGESLASIRKFNKPLDEVTTSSLEALKAYTEGARLIREKGEADAIPYYQRAIELDPNFAYAYLTLGALYWNSGEIRLAQECMRKAFELRDRVSENERSGIVAHYYLVVTGELEKSLQAWRQCARIHPEDKWAHVNLSALYSMIGEYEKCAAEGREAVRLDPENFDDYGNTIGCYTALGRFDEAKALIQQARSKGLSNSVGFSAYLLAFLEGDEAEMQHEIKAAKGLRWIENAVLSSASDTEAYHGRLRKARALSAEAVDSAGRYGAKETAALWKVNEALREAEFGHTVHAIEYAKAAMATGSDPGVGVLAALALARAGESAQAEKMLARLDAQFPLNSLLQYYWFPTVRAAIALDSGSAEAAIEALQGKTAYELGSPEQFNLGPMYPLYIRGIAYLKARQPQAAAEQFRKIIEHPGIIVNFPLGSLAHLQLARALAMAGDTEGARREYRDFFTLWKDADSDIPILQQAKQDYAKLQCR